MPHVVSTHGLILGQLLSVTVTITSTTSALLASKYSFSAPFTQSAVNYLLLLVAFGSVHKPLTNPLWKYALLGCLDCWSNWAVVKAFSLSSITSVTLLDSWTIPCVMLLTWAFLRIKYSPRQMVGAGLCIAGLAVLLLSDERGALAGNRAMAGDALVLAGATGYAVANVLQERLLVDTSSSEVLAALGGFGLLFSCVQIAAFERGALFAADWSPSVVLYVLLYGVALFAFYVVVPHMLHESGSAVMNLSILTSDFYTAGMRVLFLGGFTAYAAFYFVVSSATVAAGLVLFVTAASEGAAAPSAASNQLRSMFRAVSDSSDDQYVIIESSSPTSGKSTNNACQASETMRALDGGDLSTSALQVSCDRAQVCREATHSES